MATTKPKGRDGMQARKFGRRDILKGAAALATLGLGSDLLRAQSESTGREAAAGATTKSLPARGEFVIRGAIVLSMDAGIGELARGDVHVRDGVIVAVAA